MKIVKLETFTNEFVGFVRATSETGAQGWGQVSTYTADLTCEIFHRQVARHALGTNALDFEDTLNLISEREHKYPGSYLRRAMTGPVSYTHLDVYKRQAWRQHRNHRLFALAPADGTLCRCLRSALHLLPDGHGSGALGAASALRRPAHDRNPGQGITRPFYLIKLGLSLIHI